MLKRNKFLVVSLVALTTLFTVGPLFQEIIDLSAMGEVKAYDRINWNYDDKPSIVLSDGETVPVYRCVDTKSDLLLEIEVSNQRYYIATGEYTLLRRRPSIFEAWQNPRATFSCSGFLQGISG